jgi:hypothetical protein
MSISPRLLLNFAKSLDSTSSECCVRTIVSRAYYAALHAARESLDEQDRPAPHENGSHQKIIAAFELMGNRPGRGRERVRSALKALKALRDKRTLADYQFDLDLTPDVATFALLKSGLVVDECDQIKSVRAASKPTLRRMD